MESREILEVIARVEKAVADHPGPDSTPAGTLTRTIEICIEVLDSEHMNYPDGELERALSDYIRRREAELGPLLNTGDTP